MNTEERIAKLEKSVLILQTQLGTPLHARMIPGQTIGASILSLIDDNAGDIDEIRDMLTELTNTIESVRAQLLDGVNVVEAVAINTEQLRATLARYAAGYEIPASALRDTSRSWRLITAMLRKRATEHVAKGHLETIGVTVKRKGKFIYFVKG